MHVLVRLVSTREKGAIFCPLESGVLWCLLEIQSRLLYTQGVELCITCSSTVCDLFVIACGCVGAEMLNFLPLWILDCQFYRLHRGLSALCCFLAWNDPATHWQGDNLLLCLWKAAT
jgi:hypothetical protein